MELSMQIVGEMRGYPINDAVTGGYPSGKTEIVFLPFTTQRNQF